jgi:chromosome segregation ATPase
LIDTKELEQLQNRRAELEKDSSSLEEQQKNLENRVKTIEERIRINELEKTNKTKQETIAQLESRMRDLEQKLQTSEEPESRESVDKVKSEITEVSQPTDEPTTRFSEAIEEETEEVVEVCAIEEPVITEQENYADNLKRQNEKKKRKFF